jgi:hypothetical protein
MFGDFNDPRVRFMYEKPDADPFAKPGRRHYNRTTGRRLTPTNFMPIGCHRGKPMSRIPIDYLAWVWVHPWSHRNDWEPVRQFIELYVIPNKSAEWEAAEAAARARMENRAARADTASGENGPPAEGEEGWDTECPTPASGEDC